MTSITVPRPWTLLADETVGTPYGHVAGHQYHDVTVSVASGPKGYRVGIIETWGSAQGSDEEHGRRQIVAIDRDLDAAVRIASSRAQQAQMRMEYVVQALSVAHATALDADLDKA